MQLCVKGSGAQFKGIRVALYTQGKEGRREGGRGRRGGGK